MLLSIGIDDALVLGPTSFLKQLHPNPTIFSNGSDVVERWGRCCFCPQVFIISSTRTQPCKVIDRMPLSVGMHAALVVGPTSFLNQFHPRPTLVSNGRDAAQRVDGCCSCPGTDDIFLINSTPTQPCKVTYRMCLHVGMDVALVLGLTIVLIKSTPTQPC
jgi:hypothetical protein